MRAGAGTAGARSGRETIGRAGDSEAAKAVLVHAWWRSGRLPPEVVEPLQRALMVLPVNVHWASTWRWKWRRWLFFVALTGLMSTDLLRSYADLIFAMVAYLSLAAIAGDALAAPVALHETRREQQLISLLPGVPRAPVLNRALACRLTASYAMSVGIGVIALQVMWAFMTWCGAPLSWLESRTTLVAMPLSCVPLAALLWTNWATMKAPALTSQITLIFLPALLAAGAVVACHFGWTRIEAIALLYTVPTLLWCGWRWQRMGDEPSAFPVGRLAR